jgi:FMN phosphatase YigB (HAD superfamily)
VKNKLILADCDGVLLDWEYAFSIWMEEHGFVLKDGHQFEYDIGTRYGIDREQGRKLITMNQLQLDSCLHCVMPCTM